MFVKLDLGLWLADKVRPCALVRVPGASVVLGRRVGYHSELFLSGSTLFSRLIFAARPTRCCLYSSDSSLGGGGYALFSFSVHVSLTYLLQSGYDCVQSLDLVVDDSCFPCIAESPGSLVQV